MYVLWHSGIRGRIWRMIRNLSKDMSAQVRTKYGLTRIIKMKNNIRQGGVLSVTEYSKMVDSMCEVFEEQGVGTRYGHIIIPSLLLMDDITLMADSPTEFQSMLRIVHHQASKYHAKFGTNKCKIMTTGDTAEREWLLGNSKLEQCCTYKYLGETISRDGSLMPHLRAKENEVEAQVSNILAVASDDVLNRMNLDTSLQLVSTCVIPSLLYAAETWTATNREITYMNKTLNYTIKRILQLPQSDPSAALLMDTGIQPIESAIHKKQMKYYWKLKNEQDTVLANRVPCTQDDYYGYATNWDSKIQETLQLYALQTNDITTISRGAWRNRLNQVVNRRSNTTIQKKCLDGTKTSVR